MAKTSFPQYRKALYVPEQEHILSVDLVEWTEPGGETREYRFALCYHPKDELCNFPVRYTRENGAVGTKFFSEIYDAQAFIKSEVDRHMGNQQDIEDLENALDEPIEEFHPGGEDSTNRYEQLHPERPFAEDSEWN